MPVYSLLDVIIPAMDDIKKAWSVIIALHALSSVSRPLNVVSISYFRLRKNPIPQAANKPLKAIRDDGSGDAGTAPQYLESVPSDART